MPQATLSFALPEEEMEFRNACEGAEANSLLWQLDQHCRSVVKYEMDAHEERVRLAEEIRQMIHSHPGVTLE